MIQDGKRGWNIVILASGEGTNASRLMDHFAHSSAGKIIAVLTENSTAGVIRRADNTGVPCHILTKETWSNGPRFLELLQSLEVDFILLAGYLKYLPKEVIHYYNGLILNIHPSLLPEFGGAGMYGKNVHEAVIAAGKEFSGITIHLVDENYDEGEIIFQEKVKVDPAWNATQLQEEVHKLEYEFYAPVAEKFIYKIQTLKNTVFSNR